MCVCVLRERENVPACIYVCVPSDCFTGRVELDAPTLAAVDP